MIAKLAPNFILKDQFGKEFELYKNLDRNVLLVFYPKDDSLVCSRQLADYNRNLDLFKKNDINVVGINIESSGSHQSFCDKLGLNFPILSDTDKKVSKAYDALTFVGVNKRKLILINSSKNVVFEKSVFNFHYPTVEEILNLVKQFIIA